MVCLLDMLLNYFLHYIYILSDFLHMNYFHILYILEDNTLYLNIFHYFQHKNHLNINISLKGIFFLNIHIHIYHYRINVSQYHILDSFYKIYYLLPKSYHHIGKFLLFLFLFELVDNILTLHQHKNYQDIHID